MQTTLLMVPLHSLGKDVHKEVQHDLFGHVTQFALASVSHDTNGIANSTIAFLVSRW